MASVGTLHAPHSHDPGRLVAAIGVALALSYAVFLAGSYVQGHWLIDAKGRPVASDFVNIFAAGRLTLAGDPAGAYDWASQRAAEVAAVGYPFEGFYPWPYPPQFLAPAALLALLPMVPASLVWLFATGAAYVASIRAIVGARIGPWLAVGFPGALWTVTSGQSAFLSAALIGGALAVMERHPILAGVFLGALSYKPQLGLLFPFVLAAGGHWRTFAAAAAVTGVIIVGSWLVFGGETWAAFFQSLPATSTIVLADGAASFAKLQSAFGLVRMLGGSEPLAWTVQLALAGTLAMFLCWLWRSDMPFDRKAAALAASALLATPYLFIYDLVVLAVPVAFLIRFALMRGFWPSEVAGLIAAGALLLAYIVFTSPVGFVATLIVMTLAGRRIAHERKQRRPARATVQT
jgi:arabinofuranan 3-O-arabinosyltransferase